MTIGHAMNLIPGTTVEDIRRRLQIDATALYGHDRAAELGEQIEHLALMLSIVARRKLDITQASLGDSTRRKRSE